MRRFLLGPLMLLAASPQGTAAPSSAPPPVIGSAEAEIVRVSVAVTDKGGRPITDLQASDFVLTDEGKPQEITLFVPGLPPSTAAYEPTAAAATEAGAASDAQRRHVVLAIDDLHLSGPSLIRAREGLKTFVTSSLRPTDEIAIATTSGAGVSRAFTADRAAILSAIDSLAPNERRPNAAGRATMNQAQAEAIERNDARALELAVQEISDIIGIGRQPPWAAAEAKEQARQIVAQAVRTSNAAMTFIEDMIRGLQPLPGRKLVVLVSDGFLFGPPTEPAAFDLRRLIDASARADVAVYPLLTRGVVTEVDASARGQGTAVMPGQHALWARTQEMAVNDALGAIADGTGGQYVRGSNDVAAGLRDILVDNTSSYLIAYSPRETDRRSRFHKIEVKVPGRPDLQIRARRGYLSRGPEAGAPAAETAEQRRERDIRNGLSALVPRREIPVRLRADFVDRPPEGSQLVLSAHVDARDVRFQRSGDRRKAELEFVRVVADDRGRVVAPAEGRTAELELSDETYAKTVEEGIGFQGVVPVQPGRYEVRLAVREGRTAQVGSARQWVEVPDTTQPGLALSSVFLFAPAAASATSSDPASLKDVQPTRRYTRESALFYAVHVYNPQRDAAGVVDVVTQAQIRRDGRLQGASAAEPTAIGGGETSTLVRGRIALAGLAPGAYELRVLAVDRKAGTQADRQIDFHVD